MPHKKRREPNPKPIVVLGAGAVGVATALYLQRDGHPVLLIDRARPGMGCSYGNAGLIQGTSVVPVATPSVFRSVPRMLLDPDQPLVVRWRHLPSLMPYLMRFMWESRPARAEANSRALAAIIPNSFEAYRPLIEAARLQHMVSQTGELYLYESSAAFRAAKSNFEMRRARGVQVQEISAGEARELEPAITPAIRHAAFMPNSYQTVNPHLFVDALAQDFIAGGGGFRQTEFIDAVPVADGVSVETTSGRIAAHMVVVALGAFSKDIAKRLGSRVPLDSERGYHIMLARPGVPLKRTVLSGEYRFAMAPISGGIMLAGTAELARVGAPPRYERARRLLPLAQRLLPGLQDDPKSFWMGHRPSTPDSLPVIGRSPHHPRVFFAFGHNHSGLTLGGVTGLMVSDMVAGRPPAIDPKPYGIERFSR